MRTWSIAGALDGLRKLEKLTRPPKLGHDVDVIQSECPDRHTGQAAGIAADALADREAEEEVAEAQEGRFACRAPGPFDCLNCSLDEFTLTPCVYGQPECPTGKGKCPTDCDRTQQGCVQTWGPDAEHLEAAHRNYMDASDRAAALGPYEAPEQFGITDGLPPFTIEEWADLQSTTLIEPALSNDELVAVRQLIDERFPIFSLSPAAFTPGAGDTAADSVAPPAESGAIPNRESLSVLAMYHVSKHRPRTSSGPVHYSCRCGREFEWGSEWAEHVGDVIAGAFIERISAPE